MCPNDSPMTDSSIARTRSRRWSRWAIATTRGINGTYLLLEIDCGAVTAPIVYEDAARIFPHVYGPLEIGAVRRVLEVNRDDAGRFLSIGGA